MENWYILTLIALILFGIQRFLYKVSAKRNCNTAWTTFAFMGTVAILSTFFFLLHDQRISDFKYLFLISLINSASFFSGTIATIEALKNISTGFAYPIIRLNTGIVVIFSIFYFNDSLSPYQAAGIITAIAVILILTKFDTAAKVSQRNFGRGLLLVFVSLFSGAIAAISSKFAAMNTNLLGFMALSYFMSMLFSFFIRKRLVSDRSEKNHNDSLVIGFIMGLVNFGGFYSLLLALSSGPLSIIISITGMYFVIAILLSSFIYKEEMGALRIAATVLTAGALVLMKL
jgi:drug/metabolite transporter (DMT)-like permease